MNNATVSLPYITCMLYVVPTDYLTSVTLPRPYTFALQGLLCGDYWQFIVAHFTCMKMTFSLWGSDTNKAAVSFRMGYFVLNYDTAATATAQEELFKNTCSFCYAQW